MAKAILFVPKSDQRSYVKTGNKILLYTKITYFPNNDTTKWQNGRYLLHKAQQNQQVLKALHSANTSDAGLLTQWTYKDQAGTRQSPSLAPVSGPLFEAILNRHFLPLYENPRAWSPRHNNF